jgi:hypothetical protein
MLHLHGRFANYLSELYFKDAAGLRTWKWGRNQGKNGPGSILCLMRKQQEQHSDESEV